MKIPSNMIEQIDDIRDLDISYDVLHSKALVYNAETDETIQVPFLSIINKYRNLLSSIIVEGTLSEEEQRLYWYKPKSLSNKIYGTTELWSELLLLNNYVSIIDFTPEKLKYYDPYRFKTYINEILVIENINRGY